MKVISIIIPLKNGEATLVKCLTAIRQQSIADKTEIIILDSCSTDNSLEIAKGFSAKIINIPNDAFDHGLTRNIGADNASGELLYFTVQDAYLAEDNQLEKMILHFSDPELQAIVGMQATPHDKDKNPARWFRRITKPETAFRHFPDGDFAKLTLQEQFKHCSWDNVNAMYRKSALEKVPFTKTDFAEDWLWVKDALTEKMKIAFDPSLLVWHYHHKDFGYSFRVHYIMNYNFFRQFKVYPTLPQFALPLLKDIYRILKNNKITAVEKIYWSKHNLLGTSGGFLSNLFFIIIGKFFGEKALAKSLVFFCNSIPQGKIKND